MENVDLVFGRCSVTCSREKALERNTGARGLRSILENALLETMYDLPSRTDVGTVVVTKAVIEDGAKPEFLPERQPQTEEPAAEKIDLKVLDSKTA